MGIKILSIKATLLIVLLSTSLSLLADKKYSAIYIFGDSAADTGNLASTLNFTLPSPPFYKSSRISNGPVAVEFLAKSLGLTAKPSLHLIGPAQGTNYAVAGGRAAVDSSDPRGLTTQIASFLSNHSNKAPSGALYVMYIGANDVKDALPLPTLSARVAHVDTAIANVSDSLTSLINAGAHHIFIVNSPNVGDAPESKRLATETNDPGYIKRATKLTKIYNKKLKRVRKKISKKSHVTFYKFNLFKFIGFLIKHGNAFGFTNVTDACFNTTQFVFFPDCDNGLKFPEYFFFDELHFTARVHKFVGHAMKKSVKRISNKSL